MASLVSRKPCMIHFLQGPPTLFAYKISFFFFFFLNIVILYFGALSILVYPALLILFNRCIGYVTIEQFL